MNANPLQKKHYQEKASEHDADTAEMPRREQILLFVSDCHQFETQDAHALASVTPEKANRIQSPKSPENPPHNSGDCDTG